MGEATMNLWVIRWRDCNGHAWESERICETARQALANFRRDAARLKQPVTVLGVSDADGVRYLKLI
jgi:hypothetical protein